MPFGYPGVFAVEDAPQSLTVTPPEGQGAVGSADLGGFLGFTNSLAGAAGNAAMQWGEIRGLADIQEAPPQPTQDNLRGSVDESEGGVFGIGVGSIVTMLAVAAGIYFLGGNLAWAIVGGIAAAVLVAYWMG